MKPLIFTEYLFKVPIHLTGISGTEVILTNYSNVKHYLDFGTSIPKL